MSAAAPSLIELSIKNAYSTGGFVGRTVPYGQRISIIIGEYAKERNWDPDTVALNELTEADADSVSDGALSKTAPRIGTKLKSLHKWTKDTIVLAYGEPLATGGPATSPDTNGLALSHVRESMFCILDTRGHPVGCGFFVADCAVALTVNHNIKTWSTEKRGSRYVNACKMDGKGCEIAMTFKVVYEEPALDFSIMELDLTQSEVSLPVSFYPLPTSALLDDDLWGKRAAILHGNIALNKQFDRHPDASRGWCSISTVHPDRLIYDAATCAGDSGGALLLAGRDLVGLHVEGLNDIVDTPRGGKHFKTPSEATSLSVAGCALRLDMPELRAKVADAIASARARQAASSSSSGGGGSGSASAGVQTRAATKQHK